MNSMSGPNPGQQRPTMDQNFRGPRPMFMPSGPPFQSPFDNNFRPPLNQGMPPPFMGPRNNLSMPPGGPRGVRNKILFDSSPHGNINYHKDAFYSHKECMKFTSSPALLITIFV